MFTDIKLLTEDGYDLQWGTVRQQCEDRSAHMLISTLVPF
jgi:hypothetical protein